MEPIPFGREPGEIVRAGEELDGDFAAGASERTGVARWLRGNL